MMIDVYTQKQGVIASPARFNPIFAMQWPVLNPVDPCPWYRRTSLFDFQAATDMRISVAQRPDMVTVDTVSSGSWPAERATRAQR